MSATSSDCCGTIFALSSGAGRAAVAVIRISGPDVKSALGRLAPPVPDPRRASLRKIRNPSTGELIDEGLVLWFEAPRSATGEDVAELHVHGGRAVVAGVLGALAELEGLRLAEPGEFTRRAFFHRRLDLAQVEGLADLVAAETEAQRRAALRHTEGTLSARYEAWRGRLLRALAYVEATIDFSDEELPGDLVRHVIAEVSALRAEVETFLKLSRHAETIREGFLVAILGAPNAGKSSLLNALTGRDVAIVSERAGTTRDVISLRLDLGGYLVVLSDTAGIREAADEIETEGILRARREAERADLRIVVLEATHPVVTAELSHLMRPGDVVALNKVDLLKPGAARNPVLAQDPTALPGEVVFLSAKTGEGIETLIAYLTRSAEERVGDTQELTLTHLRHRVALTAVLDALAGAQEVSQDRLELLAEELRLATRELGRITGRVGVEDLLDLVFRDFCIGK